MTKKRSGFTLIELLVSVTIFSGLVILAIGAFARSAISAEKTDALREKTSAARSIVDQIGNDFRYIYTDPSTQKEAIELFDGGTKAIMVIKYPDNSFAKREYYYNSGDSPASVTFGELRCSNFDTCNDPNNTPTSYSNILSEKYRILPPTPEKPLFDAAYTQAKTSTTDAIKGYLSIDLSIVPASSSVEMIDGTDHGCSTEPGDCYQLQTTFTSGSYKI